MSTEPNTPSVFLSSAVTGFESTRKRIAAAISDLAEEGLHFRPVPAERFGARPESPEKACLDAVAESDILLAVLDKRYSEPVRDEILHARALRIPSIVFVREGIDFEDDLRRFVKPRKLGSRSR